MGKTAIEWTDETWNPVTGCTKVSPGCRHCYAESLTRRFQADGVPKYSAGFDKVVTHQALLATPSSWRSARRVFVCSMSDLFHPDVPDEFILKVFGAMGREPKHTFQVLTKRSDRLMRLSPDLPWQPNIWAGVSVENENYLYRADHLRNTSATIKFLSCEPLLGPLSGLDLNGLDWVIVGGESGDEARHMEEQWVIEVRDLCQAARVPFFFKQWGGPDKKEAGRMLQGRIWEEAPTVQGELF